MLSTIKSVSSGATITASHVLSVWSWCLVTPRSDFQVGILCEQLETLELEAGGLAGTHLLEIKARLPTAEPGARWVT
jgi:hypothetical protein